MNSKSNFKILSVEERAQELVSYLEQKSLLPAELPDNFRPQSFKNEIEVVLETAENALKEIQGQK